MSLKWTGSQSESGILRKSEFKEKKEELFVFGYSCKLFRDDDKAIHIDQGKHLIPWMGDETLKIDRYDARGALHDLSALEAPPGGYDWRMELTKGELDVEQLCDEERYRALHTDEDEEEMYKEEELKRLHAAGYGQVGFNYDAPSEPSPTATPVEVDEPFTVAPNYRALFPSDTVFPETQKQNAIIDKTAKFIAAQGIQMEILIKAKQRDNPQFQFLNKDSTLHPYYMTLINLIKTEKWPEKKVEVVEEKPQENEEYLHPSLASTIIESAPAIPSIQYKPSADCDYTLLVSKMRGEGEGATSADVPPPGTETAPPAVIYRAPVIYAHQPDQAEALSQPVQSVQYQQYPAYYQKYAASQPQPTSEPRIPPNAPPTSMKSTGLSLMKNYNTDSDSDDSDFDDSSSTDSKDKPSIVTPPEDVQIVVDKMASYVARNGDEFEAIVRAKNDPRFTFLEPEHIHHAYYKRLMQQKRGIDVNGTEKSKRKASAPVSFSIKKLKEPDPILPKPALPYESSSDEESEKQTDKTSDKQEDKETNRMVPQAYPISYIPQAVVYKMDGQLTKDLPTVKTYEPVTKQVKPMINIPPEVKETTKEEVAVVTVPENVVKVIEEITESKEVETESNNRDIDSRESPERKDSVRKESPQKKDIVKIESTQNKETARIESPQIKDTSRKESPQIKDTSRKESPQRKDTSRKESPQRKDTVKRDSPQRKGSPHVKESPRRRESPYKKDSPHRRGSPRRRESPYQRESSKKRESPYRRDSPHRREKRKHRDRKKEEGSKPEGRERRGERRSAEREKREKVHERDRKRRKCSKEVLETEIISLEDNSDDLIDLTGDQSDSKGECETEAERAKQMERRRRAADFLKKVGVDPAAATALPTSSLASAMVDTIETLRKKKAEEEEKRRRREKRRHRERRDYDDDDRAHRKSRRRKYRSSEENDESDYESTKKKKRKKEKKHSSKNKKKRRRENDGDEVDPPVAVNIDLTNTLKELRASPTKELVLQDIEESRSFKPESSEDELVRDKKRKREREYSEGEWSSDSEGDSRSTGSDKD